ncbi:MAG: glutaredoxin 3 [Deltaproteobacteria bacterium]|nr:glutaredoxin 3 [Deltaproteobacteria bacterium]
MSQVTIYTTPICPYCVMAKRLLQKKSIDFEEIDLSRNPALRAELSARTGMRTVPMIFIGEECIGGSDDLHALDREGELDRKLAALAD